MSESDQSDEIVKRQLSWSTLDFIERSSSGILGFAIASLGVATILFFIFALLIEIEMKVDASGEVNSASGVKEIISVIDGIVDTIEVQEGDSIQRDQVIARLMIQGTSDEELVVVENQLRNIQKTLGDTLDDTAIATGASDSELRLLLIDVSNKLSTLRFQKTQGKELLDKELAPLINHRRLLANQIDAIDKSSDRAYLLAQRAALEEDRLRLNSQIANLQGTSNLALQNATSSAEQSLSAALAKVELLKGSHQIRAPIDGRVVKLHISRGTSVRAQTAIAYLIPEDAPMIAEVYIQPHDLARIKVGAEATFSIDAFPWPRFGHFKGEVASIGQLRTSSSEIIPQTGYLTKIRIHGPVLKRSEDDQIAQPMAIVPGMKVDARIVSRRGNLFYLIKEYFFGDRI